MASGSNPADLYDWEDKDKDPTFAQETLTSGQFAQQWKLRIMAQEAALELSAYTKAFTCTYVKISETANFYNTQEKKRAPRWRGPALILDIDEAGAAARFQSQTFKVARFCVRKKAEAAVGDEEVGPLKGVCAQGDRIWGTSRSQWMGRGAWMWMRRKGSIPRAWAFPTVIGG